jgi:hypothetical protein
MSSKSKKESDFVVQCKSIRCQEEKHNECPRYHEIDSWSLSINCGCSCHTEPSAAKLRNDCQGAHISQKFADIMTKECHEGNHDHCAGKTTDGRFRMADEFAQDMVMMFFAGLRCPCHCHQPTRSNATVNSEDKEAISSLCHTVQLVFMRSVLVFGLIQRQVKKSMNASVSAIRIQVTESYLKQKP